MWRKPEITRGRDNFASLFNKHSAIKVYGEMNTYFNSRAARIRLAAIIEGPPQPPYVIGVFVMERSIM
jgi:hypothetical protein